MKIYKVTIDGMTCGHCVMSVKKELSKILSLNIKDVKIGSAVVGTEEASDLSKQITEAVAEAGYSVVSIQ